jgi:adenylate cyclase class 2
MASPLEIEIKVKCDDVGALVDRHPELGWTVVEPRHFESNDVFEMPGDPLKLRGSILRIRTAGGRATLTYKGLVPESAGTNVKIREELETEIASAETLAGIFGRLGFRRAFRYEKYRTVYRVQLADIVVLAMRDELPFGEFLELEGPESSVRAVADALGIDESRYVPESYIGIQSMLCAARGVELEDLVFAGGEACSDGLA